MGDIDIRVKNFVKLRSIFAQLFSEGVFHGKVEIDPDKLQELDTVNQETVRLAGYEFKLLHTPGHTGGSCCYYVESEKILFSGDTLFQESYGRIDFPTGSGRQMADSVVNILFALPDDTAVYPGHMGDTTIGAEKLYNPLASYIGRLG